MRISDWSSDVCSSDLLASHIAALVAGKEGQSAGKIFFISHTPQRRARFVALHERLWLVAPDAARRNRVYADIRRQRGRQPARELDHTTFRGGIGGWITHARVVIQAPIGA